MIVKDLIFSCNIDDILKASMPFKMDDITEEDFKLVLKQYIESLKSIEPKTSNGSIVIYSVLEEDSDIPYNRSSVFFGCDRTKLEKSYHSVQDFKTHIQDAITLYEKDADEFQETFYYPELYAFELTPVEEILGYDVAVKAYDKSPAELAAAIIDEMTFIGYTEEAKEKEKEILSSRAQEVEEIMKLPKEEQDEHFVSLEELLAEFGFSKADFEITPEEHQKIMREHIQYQFDMIDLLYKIIKPTEKQLHYLIV